MSGDRILIEDGGPAYPVPAVYDPAREQVHSSAAYTGEGGMTLRDRFAIAALTGRLASFAASEHNPDPERSATFAYAVADAMLRARAANS
jgi:hypothetical protein